MTDWRPKPTRPFTCQFERVFPEPQCCCDPGVVPLGDHWSPCPLKHWTPVEGCPERPTVMTETLKYVYGPVQIGEVHEMTHPLFR